MSTAAIPVHVALVDDTGKIDSTELATMAGAMSEQIEHDFAPVWQVRASVGVYATAPAGTWAVHIQERLNQPGALGFHTDDQHQPVSYVERTADWTVTVSHEVLEMLADPWGSRMHSAELPDGVDYTQFGLPSAQSRVSYLLEVCDPCETTTYAVGGVKLSDFLLPTWYRTNPSPALSYSQAGGCTKPRQVADGGYASFGVPTGHWYQVFNQGGNLTVKDIGQFNKADYGSLREWTDESARKFRAG
ncbi:MAG TPA: hypothetical protein VG388_14150 [Solirubrobacteraceae bacterium]|nr:hypothetical protein [Solirubrobacteraceae bacterium]